MERGRGRPFLMHRVELKGGRSFPNSFILFRFLMHRVELKVVGSQPSIALKRAFLMHRVELKDAINTLITSFSPPRS